MMQQGKYREALPYFERGLALKEQAKTADITTSMFNIGELHELQGHLDLALSFYQRALQMKEQAGTQADLAEALSRTSPPLLTLAPERTADAEWLQGSVTLTETGRAVLAGHQDRIRICGIDRWVGGVHLTTGADMFRWDDERQRIIRE